MSLPPFVVAVFVAVASISAAETAEAAAQIKASYSMAYSRIRPDPAPVRPTANFDVALNESGSISEQINRNAGMSKDRFDRKMKLGNGWRVISANELQRTIDQPQSTLVITITTSSNTCNVLPVWTLKPGFSEFKFKEIRSNTWSFFTQPAVTSTACTIQ